MCGCCSGGSGAARIERVCGFDPLDQVRDVIVFVLGSEGRPLEHVGFVARGALKMTVGKKSISPRFEQENEWGNLIIL